jgi:hypothetical protein
MFSRLRFWAALVLLLAVGIIVADPVAGGRDESDLPDKIAVGPTPCPPTWYTVPSPNGPHSDEYLLDVDSINENDAWTVGRHAMIQHWNGIQWSVVPGPNIGEDYDLRSVEIFSPGDVWAVGGNAQDSMVIRWNGTAWYAVTVPNIGSLSDLAVITPSDVWVARDEVLMHWDGVNWTTHTRPAGEAVTGLDAAASNDVWAVGRTIALHWDGIAWTSFPVPYPPGAVYRYLANVVVLPGGEAWAVGEWINYDPEPRQPEGGPGYKHSFVVHWDGSQWQYVNTGQGVSAGLTQVDARAANDIWAVGNTGLAPGFYLQRILHWDGSAWTDFSTPPYHLLTAVAIAGEDNVWAVGGLVNAQSPNTTTLTRRYVDPCQYPPPPTYTPVGTATPTSTPPITATPQPPRCPGERFTDVCPGDYFYQHVLDLNDLGVVSGYNSSPPCESAAHVPCFKPYNTTTRGQVAKIVSLAAGFNEPVSGTSFQDVGETHTFYPYIERMASRGIIVGYPCGNVGEPCVPPPNLPYFRPGTPVSRGQLTKMANLAFGFSEPVSGQQFEDVPPGSTFYTFTQRLYERNVITGYPCGNPEPCIPPDMRPYFRPNAGITRGQIAKIVNLSRLQVTPTPSPTPEP